MRSITMSRALLAGALALGALGATFGLAPGVTTAEAAAGVSPFAGSWSGTWVGTNGFDGALDWTASDAGQLTGTITHAQLGDIGAIRGHIREDGFVRFVAFAPSDDPSVNGAGVPLQGTAEFDGDDVLVISLVGTSSGTSFVVVLERD